MDTISIPFHIKYIVAPCPSCNKASCQRKTMQIVKNLRNLFNQYDTEENRLTHSLLHTIASDEKLFRDFIMYAIDKFPFDRKDKLYIGSQGRYGGNLISKKAKGDSIPDAVIHDDDGKTCILIESKVTASLTNKQLENHCQKQGFGNHILLLITTDREEPKMDIALNGYRIYWKPWWGIYKWMNDFTEKSMVKELKDYMEILESDIINRNETWEGMLTMFDGIPFNAEEYSYKRAKWCLKALMNELRKNPELKKIYPTADVTKGRPAVKGKEASEVWDHIGDKDHPHLSFVIKPDWTQIQITLPSIARAEWRILLDKKEMLSDVLSEIHQQLKKKQPGHVKLIIEVLHRHFRHRQDVGVIDGVMYFDVDCILDKGEKFDPKVKMFTGWLDALDCVLKGKKNVNLQIAIFARYDYVKDSIVGKPEFVDEAVRALKALKPFYDMLEKDVKR